MSDSIQPGTTVRIDDVENVHKSIRGKILITKERPPEFREDKFYDDRVWIPFCGGVSSLLSKYCKVVSEPCMSSKVVSSSVDESLDRQRDKNLHDVFGS